MTITSQQFNKKLTTKDDLVKLEKKLEKKLASKKDLKELRQEVKGDFEKFSIRALNTFATKEDLKEFKKDIAEDVNKKFDKILTAVDGITKKYQEFDIGFTMNQGAHNRFEKRIGTIEKKLK